MVTDWSARTIHRHPLREDVVPLVVNSSVVHHSHLLRHMCPHSLSRLKRLNSRLQLMRLACHWVICYIWRIILAILALRRHGAFSCTNLRMRVKPVVELAAGIVVR
jgi:hypothetical protein